MYICMYVCMLSNKLVINLNIIALIGSVVYMYMYARRIIFISYLTISQNCNDGDLVLIKVHACMLGTLIIFQSRKFHKT